MYYKGCIIKDGKIPMSDYTLTIDEDLGYWYFNPMFLMPGFNNINNIRVDYIALDIFDKEQRIKEHEVVEFMRLSRYFKAEEAYAKKNQTTDNGSN